MQLYTDVMKRVNKVANILDENAVEACDSTKLCSCGSQHYDHMQATTFATIKKSIVGANFQIHLCERRDKKRNRYAMR
jgi:hypothetical protein